MKPMKHVVNDRHINITAGTPRQSRKGELEERTIPQLQGYRKYSR